MPVPLPTLRSTASTVAAVVLLAGVAACGPVARSEDPQPAPEADASVLERGELYQEAITMEELLMGRLPGVEVRRVGTSLSVLIRGRSSFSTSNEALIIVDGVQSSGMALAAMNPKDVERVEVVKDGAAAIYGVRGANGVLIITTRR